MADPCPILILEFNSRRVGVVRDKCVSAEVGAPAVTNRFACGPDRDLIAHWYPGCRVAGTIPLPIFVGGEVCPNDDNPRTLRFGHC